jgi:hypothetical protein
VFKTQSVSRSQNQSIGAHTIALRNEHAVNRLDENSIAGKGEEFANRRWLFTSNRRAKK